MSEPAPRPVEATSIEIIETPVGPGRLHIYAARHAARAALVLGHGAGAGIASADLVGLARELPASGIDVILFEQPWRVAGKRVATAPKQLDAAWISAVGEVRGRGYGTQRLIVGGRSAGARVACRTAEATRPQGIVALAFPLHRPGVPEAGRHPELVAAASIAPVLVVQGSRDAYGGPDEIALAALEQGVALEVVSVAWAGHTFRVPAEAPVTTEQALDTVVRAVHDFLL